MRLFFYRLKKTGKDKVFTENLSKIEKLIDQKLLRKELEEKSGFSCYFLRWGLKKYSPAYYKKFLVLGKEKQHTSNLKLTSEMVDQMVKLSEKGEGVDAIGVAMHLDGGTARRWLIKILGKKEYSKRHYKGRLGGRKGRTYLVGKHIVHSLFEYKIVQYLKEKRIAVKTQCPINYINNNGRQCTKFIDFYLPYFDLYIEFAGMMDWWAYRQQVSTKISLYRKLGLRFVYVYSLEQAFELIDFLHLKRKQLLDEELLKVSLPLSGDKLFFSVQGEGMTSGKPSVFVRMSYCNLHCVWCDAYYTWQPDYVNKKEKPFAMSVLKIAEEVTNIQPKNHPCFRVILTGGEPLLFQDKLELLVFSLLIRGYDIEIETNGTIPPSLFLQKFCQFNVSPKLSNNVADSPEQRIVPTAINALKEAEKVQFKFVVSRPEDWEEIVRDYLEPFEIPNDLVCLMPEGCTEEQLTKNRLMVIDLCLKHCIMYTDRLQIIIWGNKRGT